MPKMPDKNSLSAPGSFRSGRAYPTAGDADFSAVGRGLEAAGRGVGQIAGALEARAEKDTREQDALDLIKADAAQKQGLFETERQFDADGDYATHDQRFAPQADEITNRAADLIRNPQTREKWRLKAGNDVIQSRERLIRRADGYGRQQGAIDLETALTGYRNAYTDPTADDRMRADNLAQMRNSIELARRAGIIDPLHASKLEKEYVRGAVVQDAERREIDDPDGLRRDLLGRDEPLVDDALNPELRAKPFSKPAEVPAAPKRTARFRGEINSMVDSAAEANGLDPELLSTFVQIESGGDPNARTGSYFGLLQMSREEFQKYGGQGDIFDPVENLRAGARKLAAESAAFEKSYGRKPTGLDLYLVHQQGEGGYDAHMRRPEAPAWENMASTAEGRQKGDAWAKRAIWGNIPQDMRERFKSVEDVSSADFMNLWQEKMARISGRKASDIPGGDTSGRYGMLSPLERAQFVAKTERTMKSRLEGQREQLKQSLDDDVESIRRSGSSTAPDLDTASRVLEPNQVNRYYLNKQEAEMEFRGTNDLHMLPEADLNARLEQLAPKPGEQLYEMKAKVFDKAERRARELRDARDADPARSVIDFPEVKAAAKAAAAAPDDPAAIQQLARARIDAQAKVGIPETQRSPITKAEARVLMAPVKGLEGKSLMEAVTGITGQLEEKYGPYARAAGIAAIEQVVHNRDLAEELETRVNAAFNGLPATGAQQRRLEYLTESAQASRAFGGQYVGEPMLQYGQRLGDPVPGPAAVDPWSNYQGIRPPDRAVQALIGNPALAAEFEAKYGAGSASAILNQPR